MTKHEGTIRLFEQQIDETIDYFLVAWEISYDELIDHLRRRWSEDKTLLDMIEDKIKDMGSS